jgi:hypothetical protein
VLDRTLVQKRRRFSSFVPEIDNLHQGIALRSGLDREGGRSIRKVIELRPRPGPDSKHRLDAGKIIETAKNLANDINLRLPGTNLAILARELAVLAVATEERGRQARRPFLAIRALSALAIGLVFLYRSHNDPRPSKPAFDETYLLYCTQMLGVISNLAPLHARGDRRLDPARGLRSPDARHGDHHQAPGQGRGRPQDEQGTPNVEPGTG